MAQRRHRPCPPGTRPQCGPFCNRTPIEEAFSTVIIISAGLPHACREDEQAVLIVQQLSEGGAAYVKCHHHLRGHRRCAHADDVATSPLPQTRSRQRRPVPCSFGWKTDVVEWGYAGAPRSGLTTQWQGTEALRTRIGLVRGIRQDRFRQVGPQSHSLGGCYIANWRTQFSCLFNARVGFQSHSPEQYYCSKFRERSNPVALPPPRIKILILLVFLCFR